MNDDYSFTSQVLTFGASSVIGASLNAMIPIVDDNFCERTETINVEGSVTEQRASFPVPQTICNITDDDSMLRMIVCSMQGWQLIICMIILIWFLN